MFQPSLLSSPATIEIPGMDDRPNGLVHAHTYRYIAGWRTFLLRWFKSALFFPRTKAIVSELDRWFQSLDLLPALTHEIFSVMRGVY
jgi:hypothetical protein